MNLFTIMSVKAIEDGRVCSDWYEKWGWRNGSDEDAILYNWESYDDDEWGE